jgi:hypothetical protein
MKTRFKLVSFICLALFFSLALAGVVFGQTPAPTDNATTIPWWTIINWLPGKWAAIVGTVGTALYGISEVLAHIKSIAANTPFQVISGFFKKVFGSKT